MSQAQKLPEPTFTPATKAPAGAHDENIAFDEAVKIIGADCAHQVREISINLYRQAADFAATKGIIIADTKFEFGIDGAGKLHLFDEILTPDSSRFWTVSGYRTGISPPSFDKQFVRDWLEAQPWNKKAPAPRLPGDVVAKTSEKYLEGVAPIDGLSWRRGRAILHGSTSAVHRDTITGRLIPSFPHSQPFPVFPVKRRRLDSLERRKHPYGRQ